MPLNAVVLQGLGPLALNCSTTGSGVDWLFYDAKNLNGSPCYVYKSTPSPDDYCANNARRSVTPTSSNSSTVTSYDINFSYPEFSDAGVYVCAESGGQRAAAVVGILSTS